MTMDRNDPDHHQPYSKPPLCHVVVVIPAYNEDRLIGSVVLKARKFATEVIVVDDGSSDKTANVAQSAGALVVLHDLNTGKGEALNTGLRAARKLEPDAVVVLDADGQHNPAEIPIVAAPVLECRQCPRSCPWALEKDSSSAAEHSSDDFERADIVIGSRYLENRSQVPKHRIWGHWLFNWITQVSSGANSTDSQSGFRAFSPRALRVLSFSSRGFSVESEIQMLVNEHSLKLVDVPVDIGYYEKPKRNVLYHGLQVLNGIFHLIGQYRPLLFFGLPGVVMMAGGFGMGAWVVDIFSRVGELAVGYAMISVMASILGMVSFSTGIILHSVRALLIDELKIFERIPRN